MAELAPSHSARAQSILEQYVRGMCEICGERGIVAELRNANHQVMMVPQDWRNLDRDVRIIEHFEFV